MELGPGYAKGIGTDKIRLHILGVCEVRNESVKVFKAKVRCASALRQEGGHTP